MQRTAPSRRPSGLARRPPSSAAPSVDSRTAVSRLLERALALGERLDRRAFVSGGAKARVSAAALLSEMSCCSAYNDICAI